MEKFGFLSEEHDEDNSTHQPVDITTTVNIMTLVEDTDNVQETGAIIVNNDIGKLSVGLALPEIAFQAASPTVMSPTEEHGELCLAMEKYAHAWLDMEEVCEKADAEIKAEEEHDKTISSKDDNTCDTDAERPLSPTDYTLEDDGDLNQVDYEKQFSLADRVPSPSEYSLLIESAEENELIRITNTAIPDDVFAIPDPIAPTTCDLSMYLEIQYEKHDLHTEPINSVPSVSGTNSSACCSCLHSIFLFNLFLFCVFSFIV